MRSRLLLAGPTAPPKDARQDHQPPVQGYNPAQAVFHGESVELFAPAGAEILAPGAGVVTAAEGRTVLVEHDDGTRTWFDGLLLDPAVVLGARVQAGAVLGKIPPNGGKLKAAHVCWGALSKEGKPQDPRARVVTRTEALLLLGAVTLLAGAAAILLPERSDKPILED